MTATDHQPRWYVSVALTLLPLVLVSIVLGGGLAAAPVTEPMRVAVVNLDQSGDAAGGQALTEALVKGTPGAFAWDAVDQAAADAGDYAAVVVIPVGIAVPSGQPVITVQASPMAPIATYGVGLELARVAMGVLSPSSMGTVHVAFGAAAPDTGPLSTGLTKAAQDASALSDAVSATATAADALATQVAALPADKPGAIPASVTKAAADLGGTAKTLDDALNTYADALRGLADGVVCPDSVDVAGGCDAFKQGVAAAADKASRAFVSTPVLVQSRALAQDASSLAASLKSPGAAPGQAAHDDAAQAASGLADQAKSVADQAVALAASVAQAQAALPEQAAGPADTLASLAASSIAGPVVEGHDNLGWVSALLVVALWLGALATYLVMRPVPFGASGTRRLGTFETLWPGMAIVGAQALLVAAAGHVALGGSANASLATGGVLLLAGFAFSAVNQALAAWLGWGGRFVALVVGALAAVEAFDVLPGFLEVLRGLWPTAGAVQGVRGIATGADVGLSVVKLVCWLVVGVTVVALSVRRANENQIRRGRPAHAAGS